MNNIAQMSQSRNVVKGAFRRNIAIRMWHKLSAWNQRRLAIRELNAMSDSLLRDLGIERFQISDVVNRHGDFSDLKAVKPETIFEAAVDPLHKAAA